MINKIVTTALILCATLLAEQYIDTTIENHEMIIKFDEGFDESNTPHLKAELKGLNLLSLGTGTTGNRATLFTRLFRVETSGISPQELLAISKRVDRLDGVSYCSLSPIYPLDRYFQQNRTTVEQNRPTTTPDFSDKQGYLKDSAGGIHAYYAWNEGVLGEGVTFRDVEGAWDMTHEDLANLHVGLESKSNEWMDHGTNTIGVLMGQHNGFGINGATPNAEMYTYSVYNDEGSNSDPGRTFAIAKAVEDAKAGDIIILELQDRGLNQTVFPDYGPADVKMAVWDLVKAATDDSILVVAASGNGNQNLDGASYEGYRNRGDNGSILVAGGKPEDQSKTSSSGYGDMVRLQGWGYYVTTTGGSKIKEYVLQSGSHADYTSNYTGTSSATPVVAAAMGLVQSWAKKYQDRYLGPYEMRELLVSTGTPATGEKNIGPLPNVEAAIKKLKEGGSSTLTVTQNTQKGFTVQSITTESLYLSTEISGSFHVTLHSLSGRTVQSEKKQFTQGTNHIATGLLSPGVYLLQITGEEVNSSQKICIK